MGSFLLFLGSCASSWNTYNQQGPGHNNLNTILIGAGVIGFVLFSFLFDKSITKELDNWARDRMDNGAQLLHGPFIKPRPYNYGPPYGADTIESLQQPPDDLEEFEDPPDGWWEKPQG